MPLSVCRVGTDGTVWPMSAPDVHEAWETMLDEYEHPLARQGAAFATLRAADDSDQDMPQGLSRRCVRRAALAVLDLTGACV